MKKTDKELIGNRIILRPITMDDTELIIKWRNTESVRQNFIFQEIFTAEIHNRWMENEVASGKVVQYIIYERDTEQPIGSVYLRDIDPENKKAEFGIFIGEECARGKGYGQESTRLICEYGHSSLDLHKIMLRVFEDNKAAVNSYLAAGFEEEALLRDEIRQQGKYRNIILMARFEGKK